MSVKVTNVAPAEEKGLAQRDLQVGVLYKQTTVEGSFDTIYTKSVDGSIVWFEGNRVGISGDSEYKFRIAPVGTTVVLSN